LKTICQTEGATTSFVLTQVDETYHDALRDLYFVPIEGGFAKRYPADTPHLDRIYQNFARHAEEMVLQTAGVRPSRWDDALSAFLQAVEGQQVDWWLTGSAALAVRGLDIVPRDLDLVVDAAGAATLGELLLDGLVEPVLPSPGWIASYFGRAFLHARVEWVGGVHASVDIPHATDFGPTAASRLEAVQWRGNPIRVPPLDLQLQVNQRRGLTDRVNKIERLK